jgi:hypothetical protein
MQIFSFWSKQTDQPLVPYSSAMILLLSKYK